jgi:hypothetical protein
MPASQLELARLAALARQRGQVRPLGRTTDTLFQTNVFTLYNRYRYASAVRGLLSHYTAAVGAMMSATDGLSCAQLRAGGSTTQTTRAQLLANQRLVRDYMALFTPYEGVLAMHGLGAGKTGTFIAVAEGAASDRRVFVLQPASLAANFRSELGKFGDAIFAVEQHWVHVPAAQLPPEGSAERRELLAALWLRGPAEERELAKSGVWLADPARPANLNALNEKQQAQVRKQVARMIAGKYTDLHYNASNLGAQLNKLVREANPGISDAAVAAFGTSDSAAANSYVSETEAAAAVAAGRPPRRAPIVNPFDRAVVAVDEAHNLNTRILHQLGNARNVYSRLYRMLLRCEGSRVVYLSGTPSTNFPNELGPMFNVLRRYIRTWRFKVDLPSGGVADVQRSVLAWLRDAPTPAVHDYVEFSGGVLTVTRNPLGFVNHYDAPPPTSAAAAAATTAPRGVRGGSAVCSMCRPASEVLADAASAVQKAVARATAGGGGTRRRKRGREGEEEQASSARVAGGECYACRPAGETLGAALRALTRSVGGGGGGKEDKEDKEDTTHFRPHPSSAAGGAPLSSGYRGVRKHTSGDISDRQFVDNLVATLQSHGMRLSAAPGGPAGRSMYEPDYLKLLPDAPEEFTEMFVDALAGIENERAHVERLKQQQQQQARPPPPLQQQEVVRNRAVFCRRIMGLTSYFRSAQEKLLPRIVSDPATGGPIRVLPVPMSDEQFAKYGAMRLKEIEDDAAARKAKNKKRGGDAPATQVAAGEALAQESGAYRSASRIACNIVLPTAAAAAEEDLAEEDGELAVVREGGEEEEEEEEEVNEEEGVSGGAPAATAGATAAAAAAPKRKRVARKPATTSPLLTPAVMADREHVRSFAPKLDAMLHELDARPRSAHQLIYSNFRQTGGIGALTRFLDQNGFAPLELRRVSGAWRLAPGFDARARRHYVLYTGEEDAEAKEIARLVFNGEWDKLPSEKLLADLRAADPTGRQNADAALVQLMLITAAGAEGINLLRVRTVHILEPYWHMVRLMQVIGRARRICSHADLPEDQRDVEALLYVSTFTPEQQGSAAFRRVALSDRSAFDPTRVITTDEYLLERARVKERVNAPFLECLQATAFDCSLYTAAHERTGKVVACFGTAPEQQPVGGDDPDRFAVFPRLKSDLARKEVALPPTKPAAASAAVVVAPAHVMPPTTVPAPAVTVAAVPAPAVTTPAPAAPEKKKEKKKKRAASAGEEEEEEEGGKKKKKKRSGGDKEDKPPSPEGPPPGLTPTNAPPLTPMTPDEPPPDLLPAAPKRRFPGGGGGALAAAMDELYATARERFHSLETALNLTRVRPDPAADAAHNPARDGPVAPSCSSTTVVVPNANGLEPAIFPIVSSHRVLNARVLPGMYVDARSSGSGASSSYTPRFNRDKWAAPVYAAGPCTAASVQAGARYAFDKMKTAVLVRVAGGRVAAFLPLYNVDGYTNDFSELLRFDRQTRDFAGYVAAKQGGRRSTEIAPMHKWNATNCLLITGADDTRPTTAYLAAVHDMLASALANAPAGAVRDSVFLFNRKDFPILDRAGNEAYDALYGPARPLPPEYRPAGLPGGASAASKGGSAPPSIGVCSQSTTARHADLPLPTADDWTAARSDAYYADWMSRPRSFQCTNPAAEQAAAYATAAAKPWARRTPGAVWRGQSTGCGSSPATNPRLRLAQIAASKELGDLLDAGITNFARRDKVDPETHTVMLAPAAPPAGLRAVPPLTPVAQLAFQCVINVEGNSAAYRYGGLFAGGQVVINVESRYKLWFEPMLEELRLVAGGDPTRVRSDLTEAEIARAHVIVVRHDLSDLGTVLRWCADPANAARCEHIAANARAFHKRVLCEAFMREYVVDVLNGLGARMAATDEERGEGKGEKSLRLRGGRALREAVLARSASDAQVRAWRAEQVARDRTDDTDPDQAFVPQVDAPRTLAHFARLPPPPAAVDDRFVVLTAFRATPGPVEGQLRARLQEFVRHYGAWCNLLVVEQSDDGAAPFNRGALLNAGVRFLLGSAGASGGARASPLLRDVNKLVFLDADMLFPPELAAAAFGLPGRAGRGGGGKGRRDGDREQTDEDGADVLHLGDAVAGRLTEVYRSDLVARSALEREGLQFLGGALAVRPSTFETVNGFPNHFRGTGGGETAALGVRFARAGVRVHRLPVDDIESAMRARRAGNGAPLDTGAGQRNPHELRDMQLDLATDAVNGLNSVQYQLLGAEPLADARSGFCLRVRV